MTSRASPTAASQAANTSRMIGNINDSVKWVFKAVNVIRINRDSIIPSRHSKEDIRWDRYTSMPRRAKIKARVILI